MFDFNIEMTESWLRHMGTQMPLDVFVAFATLLEEIISPIPIYMIMGVAGALAASRGASFWYVLYLVMVAAVMKTLGFYVLYVIGDKLENAFRHVINKYLGISHESLEAVGKRFTGKPWRDGTFIFLSRVMPLFPSTPISLACGVFRLDMRVYLISSFLGIVVKGALYTYSAYYGVTALSNYWKYLHRSLEYLEPALWGAVIVIIGILFYRYRKKIV
jgi:membrane protein DedA with SNARE-associated domain